MVAYYHYFAVFVTFVSAQLKGPNIICIWDSTGDQWDRYNGEYTKQPDSDPHNGVAWWQQSVPNTNCPTSSTIKIYAGDWSGGLYWQTATSKDEDWIANFPDCENKDIDDPTLCAADQWMIYDDTDAKIGTMAWSVTGAACPTLPCGRISVTSSGKAECDRIFTKDFSEDYVYRSGARYLYFNPWTFKWYCSDTDGYLDCEDDGDISHPIWSSAADGWHDVAMNAEITVPGTTGDATFQCLDTLDPTTHPTAHPTAHPATSMPSVATTVPTLRPTLNPTVPTPNPTECLPSAGHMLVVDDLTPWSSMSDGQTIVNEEAFSVANNTGLCYATNPCIRVRGMKGSPASDMYIQQILDVSTWNDITIHLEASTRSLDSAEELGFIETVCDAQPPLRTTFHEGIVDTKRYSGCLNVDLTPCDALTIRIGGFLSGPGDNFYLTQLSIHYTTDAPTKRPTKQPTSSPIHPPSLDPTAVPTKGPSVIAVPTLGPSFNPSTKPSDHPSAKPSDHPTPAPSFKPTASPSAKPTAHPSLSPSAKPTLKPNRKPSFNPSATPSANPSATPSANPTTTRSTKHPSLNPSTPPTTTANPSPNPTPPPTDVADLTCTSQVRGAYDGIPLQFNVQAPYGYRLTFDASNSDFAIASIRATDSNAQTVAHVVDVSVCTVQSTNGAAYTFTLDGGTETSGTYEVTIGCHTPNPSLIPTTVPTMTPTESPTETPTTPSPTAPTTASPTDVPSASPIETTTARPTKVSSYVLTEYTACVDTCEDGKNKECDFDEEAIIQGTGNTFADNAEVEITVESSALKGQHKLCMQLVVRTEAQNIMRDQILGFAIEAVLEKEYSDVEVEVTRRDDDSTATTDSRLGVSEIAIMSTILAMCVVCCLLCACFIFRGFCYKKKVVRNDEEELVDFDSAMYVVNDKKQSAPNPDATQDAAAGLTDDYNHFRGPQRKDGPEGDHLADDNQTNVLFPASPPPREVGFGNGGPPLQQAAAVTVTAMYGDNEDDNDIVGAMMNTPSGFESGIMPAQSAYSNEAAAAAQSTYDDDVILDAMMNAPSGVPKGIMQMHAANEDDISGEEEDEDMKESMTENSMVMAAAAEPDEPRDSQLIMKTDQHNAIMFAIPMMTDNEDEANEEHEY